MYTFLNECYYYGDFKVRGRLGIINKYVLIKFFIKICQIFKLLT